MKRNWLRWPVFFSGLSIFLFFSVIFDEVLFLHSPSLGTGIIRLITRGFWRLELEELKLIESIFFGFLPALIICFAALFRKYWLAFPLGIWFVYYSFLFLDHQLERFIILVILAGIMLPALITVFSPFIKLVLSKENSLQTEKNNAKAGHSHY